MASAKKTKRKRCAYHPCPVETDISTSYFVFPKDRKRAAIWLEACNRNDLLDKNPDLLHKNYQLCERHFEEKYISKGSATRKRLFDQAIPTKFLHVSNPESDRSEEQSQTTLKLSPVYVEGTSKNPEEVLMEFVSVPFSTPVFTKKISPNMESSLCIAENTIKRESEDTEDGMIPYMQQIEPHRKKQHLSDTLPATVDPLFIEIYADPGTSETPAPTVPSTSTVVTPYLYSTIETQTPKSFLLEIPQRRKYNRKIRKLQGKVSQLQKRLKEATGEDDDSDDDLSDEDDLQMFELLCDKYLTSSMSEFVKMQAKRGQQGGKCEDKFGDVFILYGT